MNSEKGILAVAKREARRIIASKICIWGIFAAPVLTLIILVWMMDSGLPTQIPIAIVDYDNTTTSRTLVRQLDAFPKTNIKFKSLSFREARQRMDRAEIYAILVIPSDFASDATSGRQPKLTYYTNNTFLVTGSLLFQDLKTISTLASASVGLKTGKAKGVDDIQLMATLNPIVVEAHPLNNPWLNYSLYLNNMLLPGILQLVIFMFTVSAFFSEVKSKTGMQLMNLSGQSSLKMIIGKLFPYTIIFVCIALMFMSVLYKFNHFSLNNGFMPMFAAYLCLILASQACGVIFVGVFRNYRLALSAASLVGMVSFSISGFSFSAAMMDGWIYGLSYIFPLRYFFLIYIDQGLNGISIGYSAYYFATLIGFLFLAAMLIPKVGNIMRYDTYEQ